jgi:hypothetical protein
MQTAKRYGYDREQALRELREKTPRELKAMCKTRSLPRKGAKSVLVDRLVEYMFKRVASPEQRKRKRAGENSQEEEEEEEEEDKEEEDAGADADEAAVAEAASLSDDDDAEELRDPAVELLGGQAASRNGQEMVSAWHPRCLHPYTVRLGSYLGTTCRQTHQPPLVHERSRPPAVVGRLGPYKWGLSLWFTHMSPVVARPLNHSYH